MQRQDRDGYQATHLFFMPRETWEMDEGKGMLHEPEYYYNVDTEILVEEELGNYYEYQQHSSQDYSSAKAAKSSLIELRSNHNTDSHAPTLVASHNVPNLNGNEIPVGYTGADNLSGMSQSILVLFTIVPLVMWLGDIPTPPPRRSTFL